MRKLNVKEIEQVNGGNFEWPEGNPKPVLPTPPKYQDLLNALKNRK